MANSDIIDSLIADGWLKTPRIIEAFRKIKRADFLPENVKTLADYNEALPLSHGQTISQPLVVAFMLELLRPQTGNKILDIGSGSGWTTTLLAFAANPGKVFGMEIIPELKNFGERNARQYGFSNLEFICADGTKGYGKEAPFDRILASAAGNEIPSEWKKQLKIGGRIVAPVKESIWLLEKKTDNDFIESEYPGFAFVPLVSK